MRRHDVGKTKKLEENLGFVAPVGRWLMPLLSARQNDDRTEGPESLLAMGLNCMQDTQFLAPTLPRYHIKDSRESGASTKSCEFGHETFGIGRDSSASKANFGTQVGGVY